MKTIVFSIFLFLNGLAFSSVTPQNIHTVHMLANLGFEDEAKQVLSHSFENENFDTHFLSDQFVKWSTGKSDVEMEDAFNESAFHVIRDDRASGIKAIECRLQYCDLNATEFAESFVDWGLSLMELRRLFSTLESDK